MKQRIKEKKKYLCFHSTKKVFGIFLLFVHFAFFLFFFFDFLLLFLGLFLISKKECCNRILKIDNETTRNRHHNRHQLLEELEQEEQRLLRQLTKQNHNQQTTLKRQQQRSKLSGTTNFSAGFFAAPNESFPVSDLLFLGAGAGCFGFFSAKNNKGKKHTQTEDSLSLLHFFFFARSLFLHTRPNQPSVNPSCLFAAAALSSVPAHVSFHFVCNTVQNQPKQKKKQKERRRRKKN